jgi:hypothetical protein
MKIKHIDEFLEFEGDALDFVKNMEIDRKDFIEQISHMSEFITHIGSEMRDDVINYLISKYPEMYNKIIGSALIEADFYNDNKLMILEFAKKIIIIDESHKEQNHKLTSAMLEIGYFDLIKFCVETFGLEMLKEEEITDFLYQECIFQWLYIENEEMFKYIIDNNLIDINCERFMDSIEDTIDGNNIEICKYLVSKMNNEGKIKFAYKILNNIPIYEIISDTVEIKVKGE